MRNSLCSIVASAANPTQAPTAPKNVTPQSSITESATAVRVVSGRSLGSREPIEDRVAADVAELALRRAALVGISQKVKAARGQPLESAALEPAVLRSLDEHGRRHADAGRIGRRLAPLVPIRLNADVAVRRQVESRVLERQVGECEVLDGAPASPRSR